MFFRCLISLTTSLSGLLICLTCFASTASAQSTDWSGEWVTDHGLMTLQQNADLVSGSLDAGNFSGSNVDGELTVEFRNGDESGKATIALSEDGKTFEGQRQLPRYSEPWRGWRKDPAADQADDADFSGLWLTNQGTMQIKQDGNKVSGTYMAAEWGSLEGTVTGRTITFDWTKFHFRGSTRLEMSEDGKSVFGNTRGDESFTWFGVKPQGFEHHVQPVAGEIVKGIADNGMLYYLRMPDGWTEGVETDLVVLLHGSNWTTEGMVFITNENWPDVGKKFAILGIQGESWAKWSDVDDLRFNYTYINWVGRSTLGGFPGTERESPYLVANVLDEMKELYAFQRIFVGGHSQGGYLAYMMHMHFPEKIAGSFPIAGGMIFQAEPDVFDEEDLIRSQHDRPMAILHGKRDDVVDFSLSEDAHNAYLSYGFPKVRLFDPSAGHPYDFLPVGDVINWLDGMTTDNEQQLLEFATEQVQQKNWRDVGNAIERAKEIVAGQAFAPVWEQFEAAARVDAAKQLREIERNRNGKWIDDFLRYQEDFSRALAAEEVMSAFTDLAQEQNAAAKELDEQAFAAMREGNRARQMELYQQIVDEYYASRYYRRAKDILKNSR